MTDRLPWFRCFPSALLGALAGMGPEVGIMYTTVLLRIYETGAPVVEDGRSLSFRTGMTERKATAALDRLLATGKIVRLDDGRLDSDTTHDEIEWQQSRHKVQSAAGKASAEKRAEKGRNTGGFKRSQKSQQNQRKAATIVEPLFNHLDLEEDITPNPLSGGTPPKREKRAEATALPGDWAPAESHYAKAEAAGFDRAFVDTQAQRMRNWALGEKHRAITRKADWDATFHNWLIKALAEAKTRPANSNRGGYRGPTLVEAADELVVWTREQERLQQERKLLAIGGG